MSVMGQRGSSMIYFISGYCNRFLRSHRPATMKTSLVTKSLVGGPNNAVTAAKNCMTKQTSLIRTTTYQLATPNVNTDNNSDLGRGHLVFRKLFLTPRVINRTVGNGCLLSTAFSTLNCPIGPLPATPRQSIVRTVQLNSPSGLVTFYGTVRRRSPVSTCMRPIPTPVPNCSDRLIVTKNAFVSNDASRLSTSNPLQRPCVICYRNNAR